MAEEVSASCPEWLIFVAGAWKYDSDLNPLSEDMYHPWGSMLRSAVDFPMTLANPSKLVYTPHLYGPGTIGKKPLWHDTCDELCKACYCRDRPAGLVCSLSNGLCAEPLACETFVGKLAPDTRATREAVFGNLSSECAAIATASFPANMAPYFDYLGIRGLIEQNISVVIGEWGGSYTGPILITGIATPQQDADWQDALAEYMTNNALGSFYWCVNPESADTGGLLLDDYATLDSAKIALLRRVRGTPVIQLLRHHELATINNGTVPGELHACLISHGVSFLDQRVLTPEFVHESQTWNADFDGRTEPVAIVLPTTEAEVALSVQCAVSAGAQVCVRAGGHSYTAASTCDGMLLDVRFLADVTAAPGSNAEDSGRFWVGAGNTNGDLASKLMKLGRSLPTGNHHGVGVGWTLGCGRGYLSRRHGLGCDFVVGARVVLANASLIEVTDSNEFADLLWALRGAGSQGFAVVIALLYDTLPLTDSLFSHFRLAWPRNKAADLVSFWQEWAIGHNNTGFTADAIIAGGEDTVKIEGVYIGPVAALDALLQPAISALGTPEEDERGVDMTYAELLVDLTAVNSSVDLRNPSAGVSGARRRFKNKSHMAYVKLSAEQIAMLVLLANETVPGAAAYDNWIELTPLGGTISGRDSLYPSSYGHRDALAVVQYGGYWTSAESKEAMVSHQRRLHAVMSLPWGNAAFPNYADNDLGWAADNGWAAAYWGSDNVPRLVEIKCRLDPDGIFSTAKQTIRCPDDAKR